MEFGEKLQELRKNKNLTQEELADALYVSRTAISKWESGRGYPSIDSLKEISGFFGVSIDDLLSCDKLISIAQKENRENIGNVCDMLFGITDLMTFTLMLLPLYPNTVGEKVYAVSLFAYEGSVLKLSLYWALFGILALLGIIKLILNKVRVVKGRKVITAVSTAVGTISVFALAMGREAYAIAMIFVLLIIKGVLIIKTK